MRRSEAHQGVRMIMFRGVFGCAVRRMSSISLRAAESCLGSASGRSGAGVSGSRMAARPGFVGPSAFWARFLANGSPVGSGRRGRAPISHALLVGFTARHFHEHLVRDHGFRWGYTWTKVFLQSKGLLERAPRRGAHRRKRPRRPLPAMMFHQDGSRHAWLSGQEALDLIVTMDDATSAIYSAFLTPERKGPPRPSGALAEVFGVHGLPASLAIWTVAAIISRPPRPARRWIGKRPTQVGRALAHLGVEHIVQLYSPQTRERWVRGGCFRPCRTGW